MKNNMSLESVWRLFRKIDYKFNFYEIT